MYFWACFLRAHHHKDQWRKAQQKIFSHFVLTCDDRAATVLQSIDAEAKGAGWTAYQALANKFGDARRAQLSRTIKKFLKRKQKPAETVVDYLVDMRARLTDIEKYDPRKIWEVLKSTAVVQNLADDDDSKLVKTLVLNRMAESETDGKTLPYEQIESIILNGEPDEEEEKPPKKPREPNATDLAMLAKFGGRGGKKPHGQKGKSYSGRGAGGWHQPYQQPYRQHQQHWQHEQH